MKKYAYWRVSSGDQNEARQLAAFEACPENIEAIYGDKQSGKNMNREEYQKMLSLLEPGDLVIFQSIDRLGRNYEEILEQWRILTKEKRVDVVVLDMPLLDTRNGRDLTGTFIADLVLQILSYVAQTEREKIKTRQAEGIAAMPVVDGKKVSKKTGRGFGRAQKCPENFAEVYKRQQSGELSVKEAMSLVGVGRTRWYELTKEMCCRA